VVVKKVSTESLAINNPISAKVRGNRRISGQLLFAVLLLALSFLPKIAGATVCTYTATVNENSGSNALLFALSASGLNADSCTNYDIIVAHSTPQTSSKGTWTDTADSGAPYYDNEIFYTPNPGATGTDTFTIADANDPTITLSVTITITPVVSVPTITSIGPTSGPSSGGTNVLITGTNFTGVTAVKFGATAATTFTVNSATQIIAVAPARATGATDITVTTSGGTSATSPADNFTYLDAPVAGVVSKTVLYDSSANAITLNLSGGTAASVAVASAASHGTATASGISITYTPVTGYFGSDSFTYTATNAGGTSSAATVSITVSAPTLSVTPATLAAGTVGTAYSRSLSASGGQAPYTFSTTLASGTLPAGLSLSSIGAITGTPTASCTCRFTVSGTDSSTATHATFTSGIISFTVNAAVPGAPVIGTATAGDAQASVTFTAPVSTGGAAITGYTVTSSSGGITGTGSTSPITVTGLTNGTAYTFTVTATNGIGTGAASAASNSVTPKASQTITFANPGTQNFGTSPTLSATATSGLAPTFTSSATGVCTITSGGALIFVTTGTCTINADQAGNSSYSAAATVSRSFSVITVVPGAPTIGTATAGNTQASVSFAAPASSGGSTITGYTVISSPGGFTSTGSASPITVTGLTNGTAYTFTVTATNSAGTGGASAASNSVTPFALPVAGAVSATVAYDSSSNPITLNLSGGTATSVAVASTASHGTATASGTSITYTAATGFFGSDSFTYTATNVGGTSSAATVSITVSAPTFSVTPTTLTTGTVGTSYSQTLLVGGGQTPYTFSTTLVSGALPAGLSLGSTGTITGTPTSAGTFTFTVSGTDSSTATHATFISGTISLSVNAAAPIATQAVASTALTQNHAATSFTPVTGSGGTGSLTYSVSPALPTGLSMTSGTGAISGTPSATSGATIYTVTVKDSINATGTATFTLSVNSAVIATQAVASAALTQGHAATTFTPVTGTGGTGSLTYSIAPTLPTGLSMASGTGAITGTPSVASSPTTYTVTVTDTNSATATATFSLIVNGPIAATQAVPSTTLAVNHAATAFTPVTGAGGTGSLTYSVSPTLPAGLSMISGTGAITGTPTVVSSAATYTVTVTDTTNSTATATFSLTVVTTPVVSSISPAGGAAAGGTSVTITGTGFAPTSTVKFGTASAASVIYNSATSLTAVSPASAAGAADITVTTAGATSSTSAADQFTYVAAPAVTTISPASGLTVGGTSVTITGTNFTGATAVQFGTNNAASFAVNSSTQITATTPVGTAGTVDVTVTTTGGTSPTSSTDQFTYLAHVSSLGNPLNIAIDGGGNLYIADSGLSYIVKVPVGCTTISCETLIGSGLLQPAGVAVDGSGDVYVIAGGANGVVLKIPWNAGSGSYDAQMTVASGLALNAGSPAGVAVDGAGNVYFTDTQNRRVAKVPWNANAGAYGVPTTVLSGSNVLLAPSGVAVDGTGNVYIADASTHTVLKVAPDGTQTTLASSVASTSVAVDGTGDVYYSDGTANTVTKLPWTGTAFGTPVALASAGLNAPYGLTVDENGNVYVVNGIPKTMVKVDVTVPPGLIFPSTHVEATSSPQTVTLANIGNMALAIEPTTGTNPSLPAGFILDSSTTCPQISTASSAQALAQGLSCNYAVEFSPTSSNIGNDNGSLVITDDNLNAAGPGFATQSIALSGTGVANDASSITVNLNPASPVVFGQAVSIGASVTDTTTTSTTATGNVTFKDTDSSGNVTTIGSAVALSAGVASITSFTPASLGTHTITANYAGVLGSIAQSSGSATLTVNKAAPTLTYTPATSMQTYGTAVTANVLNAIATDINGSAVSGSFAYTTMVKGTSTLLAAGSTVLPAGTYSITATFTPSDTTDYVSGGVTTASYTVNPAAATATVVLSNLSQTYTGSPLAATATTTPAGLNVAITYNGSATAPTAVGSYAVVATINDPNYAGTVNGTLVIAKASPTIMWANPAAITYGAALGSSQLNATANFNGVTVPGTYTYSPVAVAGSVPPSGSQTLSVTFTPNDTTTYKAVTGTTTLTVNKAAPLVVLTTSATPALAQNAVTLTATVSSGVSAPTGTVSFLDGTTMLGSGTLSGGVATLATTTLAAGSHSITAIYSGDANFVTLTSAALTELVQDFSLSISSDSATSQTVIPGGTATYMLLISPVGGNTFPAAVNFAFSGLPSGAAATFTPQTLAAGSGTTKVTLTIQVPKQTSMLQQGKPLGRGLAPVALGVLLLPFSRRLRRSAGKLGRVGSIALLLFAGFGMLAGLTGCGYNSGFFAQQQQTYNVTITGASGALTHTATVTLTVE
jgi:sugar lactone lactonase YvrE